MLASLVPACFAAGRVREVNLHMGQSADTVYLTYTSSSKTAAPDYGFLEVNSAVPAQNSWGTDTSETRGQTCTLISVDGDETRFQTYMLRYDGKADRMVTKPYLYDSLILRRGVPRCAVW